MKEIRDSYNYGSFILTNYTDYTQKYEYPNGDVYHLRWITYKNGGVDTIKHSLDGPAVDCQRRKEWWIEGKKLNCSSQEEFERIIKILAFS